MAELRRSVLLLHEGELDDLLPVLRSLDVEFRRIQQVRVTEGSERCDLLVAWAPLAIAVAKRVSVSDVARTTIAVADGDSRTLGAVLRLSGFDYLVRRPVHPEALRLLLLGALHRGDERRRAVRMPAGCEVAWRDGWKRRTGTLLELSIGGARLLSKESLRTGSPLRISVPRSVAGWPPLKLPGRVRRVSRDPAGGGVSLAVAFDSLPSAARERLTALLAKLVDGPIPLPRDPTGEGPAAGSVGAAACVEEASETDEMDGRDLPVEKLDRRSQPRAAYTKEVVALEGGSSRVCEVLIGRDLSSGGMRVEPHATIGVGDRIRIALYDCTRREPVQVTANVLRDDGGLGLGLAFEVFDPTTAARIQAMAEGKPTVEGLDAGDVAAHVIVARVVQADETREIPIPDDLLASDED